MLQGDWTRPLLPYFSSFHPGFGVALYGQFAHCLIPPSDGTSLDSIIAGQLHAVAYHVSSWVRD